MSKIIIANWKKNIVDLSEWKNFSSSKTEVVICSSFVQLQEVKEKLPGFILGAQDILKDAQVEYVIVGHSDRRYGLGETDEIVAEKVSFCFRQGLKVILCVGEQQRESLEQAKNFVSSQLEKNLDQEAQASQLVVAYEPVWAISTSGETADKPEESLKVIRHIRKILRDKNLQDVRIIYGGSVDAANIAGFIQYPEIQGALVGKASLDFSSFRKIIEIAEKYA